MGKRGNESKYFVLFIYAVVFVFFGYKMLFYAEHVGRFPDEIEHVSYIAYLEETHKIIPEFKDMKLLEQTKTIDNSNIKNAEYKFGSNLNYLGHPPLYYHIMQLSGAVQIKNNNVVIDFIKLRSFNIALNCIAIALILYIGYSRIGKNILLHCLYAAIVVSVPMLAYVCAGINNDNLALIGLSIFMFGILRFSEQKRNYFTYFIISLGVFISFMSKLTSGLIVFISLFLYIILIFIRERNLWFLISKKFLSTIPIYFITIAYYIITYIQTGSILPTYKILDPEGFYKSGFYVDVANRTYMSFTQYIMYFAKNFLQTWTGIASHVSLTKVDRFFSLNNIALIALLVLPILLLFQIKKYIYKYPVFLAAISVYFGVLISIIVQCLRAYNEFINVSGYLGGFQSRYYLCGISAIALAVVGVVSNYLENNDKVSKINLEFQNNLTLQCYETKRISKLKKVAVYSVCLFFISLLFYEDFMYFLINFKDYL